MSIGYYEFKVREDCDGMPLRAFLRLVCSLSARSLTVIKYSGGSIRVAERELRARDILHSGEIVQVRLPKEECGIEPVKGSLSILYEDDYMLIVNKPAAMPVHPTKVHQLDTLANIASYYQQSRGENYTFRTLNRLDKDTSGCVIIAKDRIAYSLIQPTIHKTYVAVCEGVITESGTVNAPIGLAPDSKMRRCVCDDGAEAITIYQPLSCGNDHTLCQMELLTGRTHQIRCHMSSIGHPLAGDDLYGGRLKHIRRQALHCQNVELTHPVTGEQLHITTEIPGEFLSILKEPS